jgi:hypothetical protein
METRIKRYKRKRIKNKILWLLKKLLKLLFKLIRFIFKVVYKVLEFINNMVAKLFMKLPRILRVEIIYLLIFGFSLNFINNTPKKVFLAEAKSYNTIKHLIQAQNKPVEERNEKECVFDTISCKIAEKGKKIGLNEEQILISIAISKWETGNYTSVAFKEKNNVGGMMCNNKLKVFENLDEGIEAFINNLKNNYFDMGLDTLEKIQPKYCPVGADNDPKGLNKYWLNGTNKMLEELKR